LGIQKLLLYFLGCGHQATQGTLLETKKIPVGEKPTENSVYRQKNEKMIFLSVYRQKNTDRNKATGK